MGESWSLDGDQLKVEAQASEGASVEIKEREVLKGHAIGDRDALADKDPLLARLLSALQGAANASLEGTASDSFLQDVMKVVASKCRTEDQLGAGKDGMIALGKRKVRDVSVQTETAVLEPLAKRVSVEEEIHENESTTEIFLSREQVAGEQ